MDLLNKRILLIEPSFFNYGKEIKSELLKKRAAVDTMNFHKNNIWFSIGFHFSFFEKKLSNNWFCKQFKKLKYNNYDFVFVINGGKITRANYEIIFNANPNAKTILYLWDSIKANPSVLGILQAFNTVISFDKNDCIKYKFKYLPLFYVQDFFKKKISNNLKYDIAFVGKDHTDRYSILKKYKQQADEYGLSTYFHLYVSKLGFFKRLIFGGKNYKGIKKDDFKFKILNSKEISKIYDEARCIIDIEHAFQSGFTIRTFELLASNKKMITTNPKIIELELYNDSNIEVINRNFPVLNMGFIKTPFVYNRKILYYSLENWIKNIFSIVLNYN